ncbi:MAG: hypothetical protein QG675_569 [Patescibacteria group bacterium]|jgi:hypothetical protein|nr:hypothetical protein [Patescibacteria group bacterium]
MSLLCEHTQALLFGRNITICGHCRKRIVTQKGRRSCPNCHTVFLYCASDSRQLGGSGDELAREYFPDLVYQGSI